MRSLFTKFLLPFWIAGGITLLALFVFHVPSEYGESIALALGFGTASAVGEYTSKIKNTLVYALIYGAVIALLQGFVPGLAFGIVLFASGRIYRPIYLILQRSGP